MEGKSVATRRKNCVREKGFTLLEILVVITLILIIAGIAIPRFAGVSDEGRKSKAAAELRARRLDADHSCTRDHSVLIRYANL